MDNYYDHEKKNVQGIAILPRNEVFQQLKAEIEELMEILPYDFDTILEIFHEFKWNAQKINENYFNDVLRPDYDNNFASKGIFKKQELTQSNGTQLSSFCFDNSQVSTQCGHSFCRGCWNKNLEQQLIEHNPFMTCIFEGCKQVQFYSFIKDYAWPEQFNLYRQVLINKYVEEHKFMCWCLRPSCQYCIKIQDFQTKKDIKCICNFTFCFYCKIEIHKPTPCDLAQKWVKGLSDEILNLEYIVDQTQIQICPFCSQAVSNFGGLKVLCNCGNTFCSDCGESWYPIHDSLIYCPMQQNMEPKKRQQAILTKFNYNNSLYLEMQNSEKNSNQKLEKLLDSQAIEFKSFDPIKNNDYLYQQFALKKLATFQKFLKWQRELKLIFRSFCYCYFKSIEDENESDLYFMSLSQFQKKCRDLECEINNFQHNCVKLSTYSDDETQIEYRAYVEKNYEKIKLMLSSCSFFQNRILEEN